MADDKTEEVEETETEEVEETETDETETDDDKGWERMSGLVRSVVREELSTWSGPKSLKQTSSPSRKPPVKKAPERKKGFLSEGFFKGLGG